MVRVGKNRVNSATHSPLPHPKVGCVQRMHVSHRGTLGKQLVSPQATTNHENLRCKGHQTLAIVRAHCPGFKGGKGKVGVSR